MKPINVYCPPRSIRIAIGEEDADSLVNYIFHALEKLEVNQVLKLNLSDVDLITYPCLMEIIRRLAQEISKGGKHYNKFMVINDLPRDSQYRKDIISTLKAVIDKIELPILLMGNATLDLGVEFKVLGSVFNSHPFLNQVFTLIREEEKHGKKPITASYLGGKLNIPTIMVSRVLRRLHSLRLLIREHIYSSEKTYWKYHYVTVISKAEE